MFICSAQTREPSKTRSSLNCLVSSKQYTVCRTQENKKKEKEHLEYTLAIMAIAGLKTTTETVLAPTLKT